MTAAAAADVVIVGELEVEVAVMAVDCSNGCAALPAKAKSPVLLKPYRLRGKNVSSQSKELHYC